MSDISKTLVIKISGSLLYPPRESYLITLKESILELLNKFEFIGIVSGGGPLARDPIKVLRNFDVPESMLDVIGIEAARFNALVLAQSLYPLALPRVPRTLEEVLEARKSWRVVVLGGMQPGQSTNAVSVALADAIKSKLIINMLSDVDGIYIPAPGVPGAVKVNRMSCEELYELVKNAPQTAGSYELFDHTAINLLKRSKISVRFVNGQNPKVVLDALSNEGIGTLVTCQQ